jgi:hypothetical protein
MFEICERKGVGLPSSDIEKVTHVLAEGVASSVLTSGENISQLATRERGEGAYEAKHQFPPSSSNRLTPRVVPQVRTRVTRIDGKWGRWEGEFGRAWRGVGGQCKGGRGRLRVIRVVRHLLSGLDRQREGNEGRSEGEKGERAGEQSLRCWSLCVDKLCFSRSSRRTAVPCAFPLVVSIRRSLFSFSSLPSVFAPLPASTSSSAHC